MEDSQHFHTTLNRCMTRVQSERIFQRSGGANEEYMEDTAFMAVQMIGGGTQHWLKANNMYGYLYRNRGVVKENQWITIYVPGLRSIYQNFNYLLTLQEQKELSQLSEAPEFINIYSHRSLQAYERLINVYEYQLRGTITKFDVLHFRAQEFVDSINRRYILSKNILIDENDNMISILLNWSTDDLFDVEYQRDMSTGKLKIPSSDNLNK